MTPPLVLVLSFASLSAARVIAKAGGAPVLLAHEDMRTADATEALCVLAERCDVVFVGTPLSRERIRVTEHAKARGVPVVYELGRVAEWIAERRRTG